MATTSTKANPYMVTEEKLNRSDTYRLQVNIPDKEIVAFLYNAMAMFLNDNAAAKVRNRGGVFMEKEIKHTFSLLVESTPAFSTFIPQYINEHVEPKLRARALKRYRENGWQG